MTTSPINVLITLPRGYGMGDACQMSAVLRHVVKYHPHWHVDLQAEAGRYCVGRGIVENVFELGKHPYPDKNYDAEVQLLLYDTWPNFHDRPNTRVSTCLRDRFGLEWDAECGRYEVNVRRDVWYAVQERVFQWTAKRPKLNTRMVAVHYQGDSSPEKKNLSNAQALAVFTAIRRLGREPFLLDWRGASPIDCPGVRPWQVWGGDAEVNCAVISQCEAFVGIDSGPAKCASATDTPALVVWTGHHPAPFHDPAPNTTHLVPRDYHGLEPVCDDPGVIEWFESHYNVRTYKDDPVEEIESWLRETLPPA
jgi:hypothetical protein